MPRDVHERGEVPPALDHDLPRPRSHVVAGDRGRVAAGARREEERATVRQPGGRPDEGLLVVPSDLDPLAGLEVDEPEHVVPRALGVAGDRERPPVGREARRVAPAAGGVRAALLPGLEGAHVDVEVDPVAPVRGVREHPAVAREARRPVDEARIVDERLRLTAGIEQVELRALVAGVVHLEQHALGAGDEPADDRLVEVGEALEEPARTRHAVQLHRPREIRGDEHRLAVGGEVRGQRDPRLEEVAERDEARHYAATPAKPGMISSPYALSVSSWPCVIR